MSIGFKTSLFGYNKNDVNTYIEEFQNSVHTSSQKYENIIESQKEKIAGFDDIKSNLEKELLNAQKDNQLIMGELVKFKEKFKDIEELKQKVATLYEQAKQSAQIALKGSQEITAVAQNQLEGNLQSVEDTLTTLDTIKAQIEAAGKSIEQQMENVKSIMEQSREKISTVCTANEQIFTELNRNMENI